VYAHKGRTKKLKRHGLHGLTLDQPSIDGIGPIKRSEKKPLNLQKKNALRGNAFLFNKKCGLDKFWPEHVSDCFRPFPTVSIFSERLIGPIPSMEG
jgi:hypothetical protein